MGLNVVRIWNVLSSSIPWFLAVPVSRDQYPHLSHLQTQWKHLLHDLEDSLFSVKPEPEGFEKHGPGQHDIGEVLPGKAGECQSGGWWEGRRAKVL